MVDVTDRTFFEPASTQMIFTSNKPFWHSKIAKHRVKTPLFRAVHDEGNLDFDKFCCIFVLQREKPRGFSLFLAKKC